jgi:hypothetical protein
MAYEVAALLLVDPLPAGTETLAADHPVRHGTAQRALIGTHLASWLNEPRHIFAYRASYDRCCRFPPGGRRPMRRPLYGASCRVEVRPVGSDAALGVAAAAGPVLEDAHGQAVRPERLRQRDRVAVEAVEREERPVAQHAGMKRFQLHVVADGP